MRTMTCGHEDTRIVTIADRDKAAIVDLYTQIRAVHMLPDQVPAPEVWAQWASTLSHLVATIEVIDPVDCPFEGDVETDETSSTVYWTCPVCRYRHETPRTEVDD